MQIVQNKGVGANFGWPDVCLTPPPFPYPNIGLNAMMQTVSPNLFIGFTPALFLASYTDKTFLDQPGRLHPLWMEFSAFIKGYEKVLHNFLPSIHIQCKSIGNGGNCTNHMALIPSATVTLYNDGSIQPPDLHGAALNAAELDATKLERDAGLSACRVSLDGVERDAIRIERFHAGTATRLWSLVRRMAGPLTLDLRGCPGGDAEEALRVAADFLPRGTVVARARYDDGEVEEFRAEHAQSYSMDLELLIDGHTASAAELFARVLQFQRRAAIRGEPSVGKTTAQQLQLGLDGGAYLVSVATFELPDGTAMRRVLPD